MQVLKIPVSSVQFTPCPLLFFPNFKRLRGLLWRLHGVRTAVFQARPRPVPHVAPGQFAGCQGPRNAYDDTRPRWVVSQIGCLSRRPAEATVRCREASTDQTGAPMDASNTNPRPLTRRGFIRRSALLGGAIVAGQVVFDITGCGTSDQRHTPASGVIGPDDVLVALYPTAELPLGDDAVRDALAQVDLAWLGQGDTVLVKIASNSGYAHPSVTSPSAVRAVVAALFDRGAGKIIVGEQSGVQFVRHVADGRRFSSTRERLRNNGLLEAITSSGAEAYCFDDQDYDAGFFEATLPDGSHWARPLMLPTVIREADHIVVLPRISSHAIAGYTLGHKAAIGWLRDDSRNHLHTDAQSFYEKYTEINYVPEIRDRFRLALVYAEKLLLHLGPDEVTGGFASTIVDADPRIVLASTNLANLDTIAVGLLVHLNQTTPVPSTVPLVYSQAGADAFNRLLVSRMVKQETGIPWGPATAADYTPLIAHAFEQGISRDRALARAWELTGGRPATIRVVQHGARMDAALRDAIVRHGEGTLALA